MGSRWIGVEIPSDQIHLREPALKSGPASQNNSQNEYIQGTDAENFIHCRVEDHRVSEGWLGIVVAQRKSVKQSFCLETAEFRKRPHL